MKRAITVIVALGILAGLYFAGRYVIDRRSAASLSSFQTVVAGRGSLTASVGATGIVKANQTAVLSWQTSGKVLPVAVEVGEAVKTGQVLASLDTDTLAQNVILARADLVNAQKALDNLLMSTVNRTQASQAVINARQAVIEAERALDKYAEKAFRDKLDKAKDDMLDAKEKLDKAIEDLEPYLDRDPENERRKDLQQKVDDTQITYDEAVRVVELLELEREWAETQLSLSEAQLADAEREYERLKDGPHPDDVAALEARVTAAQAVLDQVELVAPFDGTITMVETKAGDQATLGKAAYRLDDLLRLLVETRVSEVDVNRVRIGQEVHLTFDAILNRDYKGVVTEVSRVGTTTQGVVEFVITVELTDADDQVRPGMTAAVNIIVDQLQDVLLVPNRAVRLLNGQRVVYLLRNGNLEAVSITLGASADTNSEVVEGGLAPGDIIVLNPPQVFDTSGPPAFVRR